MWSMAALAAEAAEDRPRASMIAAPRLPKVGMKVSAFHAASLIFSFSDSPLAVATRQSGYLVGLWLPPTTSFLMSPTATSALAARWLSARSGSRGSIDRKSVAQGTGVSERVDSGGV